jgi:hypothetical protein
MTTRQELVKALEDARDAWDACAVGTTWVSFSDAVAALNDYDKENTPLIETHKCNTHPNAPHGFSRNASHNEGRYVCECEHWEEK